MTCLLLYYLVTVSIILSIIIFTVILLTCYCPCSGYCNRYHVTCRLCYTTWC